MVRISKLSDYAILLLLHLARAPGESVLASRELAERTGMPAATASKLLKALTKGGLVVSQRGVQGGYRLSRPATEISVGEALRAIEGPVALTECQDVGGEGCARAETCELRPSWTSVNAVVRSTLERMTLAELFEAKKERKIS